MKKIFILFIILMCGTLIISCTNNTNANNKNIQKEDITMSQNTNIGKSLVIYSSFIGEQYSVGVIDKGNTEIVADMIIEKIGRR